LAADVLEFHNLSPLGMKSWRNSGVSRFGIVPEFC
jgi:hypothetical protein